MACLVRAVEILSLLLIRAAQCLWICCELLWATLSVCQRHGVVHERVVFAGAAIFFWAQFLLLVSFNASHSRKNVPNAVDAKESTQPPQRTVRAASIARVPLGLGGGLLAVPP